ncbi:bifunctional diaminohydroxyphosphoribosylaminopyrimidine deaminase/5-amino-6-(5-phosphoribosylamino)uracil reductase RibD [Chloroflexota bacterium]
MNTKANSLDEDYMKQALRLARRGLGKTSPNPMVGAVIVKDKRIIGQGYHRRFGGKHAEINAFENAGESINGATLYVTLEPCCHYGKTPPCVDAVIREKLGRVVIGTTDPNPLVNGNSISRLKQQDIVTTVGVLENECRSLNEAYFKYIITGLPLVTVKFAQTLDGRIATATGSSRWISSAESQRLAHKLRITNDAIMAGIGTILADDPQLTARLTRGKNPTRIVLDSRLRISPEAKVLADQTTAPTIVITTAHADKKGLSLLKQKGIDVLVAPEDERDQIDIGRVLKILGERGITSVLVEGGAEVITSLLHLKLADKLVIIVAPRIMGEGIAAVGELNIRDISQTLKLSFTRTYRLGEDLVIEASIRD